MMNGENGQLFEKLMRLQWLMQRDHFRRHAQHGPMGDTTRGQGRVLAMLKLQSPVSTKDLSYLLGIRNQSLNELLAKLEKSGYVTREPSPDDRRVMLVGLTEKGNQAELPREERPDIFGCLTDEERDAFEQSLDKMIAALEARLGDLDEAQREWGGRGHGPFGGRPPMHGCGRGHGDGFGAPGMWDMRGFRPRPGEDEET